MIAGGVAMLAMAAFLFWLQIAPSPFRYAASRFNAHPPSACAGVPRTYHVMIHVDATPDRPVVTRVVRTIWSVTDQRNVRTLPFDWYVYTSRADLDILASFTPAADLPSGQYEYRVARTMEGYPPSAYVVPFVVEACP